MTKHERYNRSPKGRARYRRYRETEKGRANTRRYRTHEAFRRRVASITRVEELIEHSPIR